MTQHRFDVALSFPGEHRPYVERVAAKLGESLGPNACFYDKNYRAQLAAPNADLLLQAIYRERSDLVVAFICREYDEKKWCGIEWRKIRERLSDGGEAEIMYVRLGSGDVEGMTTLDGYVDAREERPEAVAGLIVERLQVVKSRNLRDRDRPGSRVGQTQPDMDRRHEGAKSESHAKVVAAVEALGKSVKVCQEVFSGAMTALNLLTASELDGIFHGRHVGDGTVEYMLEEYRDIVHQPQDGPNRRVADRRRGNVRERTPLGTVWEIRPDPWPLGLPLLPVLQEWVLRGLAKGHGDADDDESLLG